MSDTTLHVTHVPDSEQDHSSTIQESSAKPFDNLAENDKETFWDVLDDYYNQNEQTIKKAMEATLQSGGADGKGSSVVADMNSFLGTSSVVLDVLDILGHAHPVLEGI